MAHALAAYSAIFASSIVIGGITGLLTADITPLGTAVHSWLAQPRAELASLGIFLGVLTGILLFLGYLSDIFFWKACSAARAAYHTVLAALPVAGLSLLTPVFPPAPLFCGLLLNIIVVRLAKHVFGLTGSRGLLQTYLNAVSLAYAVVGMLLLIIWVAWLVHNISDSQNLPIPPAESEQDNSQKGMLVRFASPAILAFMYFTGAVCTWMRKAIAANTVHSDNDRARLRVRPALMLCLALLLASIVSAYIGLAMSPYSKLVDRLGMYCGAAGAVMILAYLGFAIGGKRTLDIAMQDAMVKQAVACLQSDMARGAFALLLLPASPLIFAVDALHQATRRDFWRRGLLEEDPGAGHLLTRELRGVAAWEKAVVLPIAMYWGLAIVAFRTVAAFVPPFMAWLNMVLAPASFAVVLLISASVATLMFLLPPVSGQMIYLPISMIIIERLGYDNCSKLTAAILAATLFCLAMKLCASALQQKAIGAPFASNIAVKKTFALHTAPYRVARSILSQRGMTLRKVIVLTGMPDWPISVLCGILDLPLLPILVGTLPEVFKILPNCMAIGFLMKSREEKVPAMYGKLFQVCLALALLIPVCLTMLVGALVKVEMEKHKAEFSNPDSDWHRDPQENEILAAIEKGQAEAEVMAAVTAWRVQPCWIRLSLAAGSLLASFSAYMAGARPFGRYDFKDPTGLEQLPGGSMAGLIRLPGYVMLALAGAVCVFVAAFRFWCYFAVRRSGWRATCEPTTEDGGSLATAP